MSVFEGATNTSIEEGNDNSPTSSIPEELTELIGEGKKYKSMEDALRSVPHAQGHISRLEQELAELKEDLGKRLNAEESLNKILEARANSGKQDTPPNDVTPEALKDLVKSTYKEITDGERQASNVAQANQAMQEKWGDKAADILRAKAQELGVGVKFLEDTASHSPKAFYNLVGLNAAPKQQEMSQQRNGSVNTETMSQTNGLTPYSYKWYQQMRRDNAREYYKPKVQMEMHRKAGELGDSFYN